MDSKVVIQMIEQSIDGFNRKPLILTAVNTQMSLD